MKYISSIAILFILSCTPAYYDTIVIVSADSEWKAVKNIIKLTAQQYHASPYGEWFVHTMKDRKVLFFHGGWGKIDAAGSAQYAISKWNPKLIINIGTAGGFPGKINKGELLCVTRAVSYDIFERMGDSSRAVDYYSTDLKCPIVKNNRAVRIGIIASGDQDLLPGYVPLLARKYGAVAGDWESAAIAHICKKNNVKCYIIRGITDIVHKHGSEAYGNIQLYEAETKKVMKKLLDCLPDIS